MNREIIIILAVGFGIELLTVFLRVAFGSMKHRFYHEIKPKHKWMPRIHHLYVGIAVALFGILISNTTIIALGLGVALSDALHHFIVLPLWKHVTEFP